MVHPGISFQCMFPLSSEILKKMFMFMNFLVLSYLIVFQTQLLIQHDVKNPVVGCHLGIIKQFFQHVFHFNEIKDNLLFHQ